MYKTIVQFKDAKTKKNKLYWHFYPVTVYMCHPLVNNVLASINSLINMNPY